MPSHGVYLLTGPDRSRALTDVDGFFIAAHGPLAEIEVCGDLAIAFDGILTSGGDDDLQKVAAAFREGGIESVRVLEGFYRAIIVDRRGDAPIAYLATDAFATRPAFVYQRGNQAAIAPTPQWFAEQDLPCFLDRQGLYQICRVFHPIGARSLIREVHKARPMRYYRIDLQGRVEPSPPPRISAIPDPTIDHAAAADLMHEAMGKTVMGIARHPKLAGHTVSLPLTSGMDSRHILACLLENGIRPAELSHVRIQDKEYQPVAEMAAALELPLRASALAELPLAEMATAWMRETAGLAHLHQLYLLGVGHRGASERMLSFDGYLAGFFFGFYLLPKPLGQRIFSPRPMELLFPDHQELEAECQDQIGEEAECWQGSENFVRRGLDIFNRGPGYTSAMFPILAGMDSFGPSAHPSALNVYRQIPEHIGEGKRARLELFRRHYPKLGRFPSEYGDSYNEASRVGPGRGQMARDALEFALGMIPGLGRDPAPGTANQWLRTIDFYRRAMERFIRDSALARDNHLSARWLRALWTYEKRGGFAGWMLMGLLSAEVSYRLLVERQPVDDVSSWLCRP